MRVSTKAAIYSGLVFPGAGYFVVKAKQRGALTVATVLICLLFIIYEVVYKAQHIANTIISTGEPYNINHIRELIKTTPGAFNPDLITSLSLVIVFAWIIGIVDSYRLGRLRDHL